MDVPSVIPPLPPVGAALARWLQALVEHRCGTEPPIGPEGVIRDFADALPTMARVQAVRGGVCDRVEHEQPLACVERCAFGREQQRSADAGVARASMHEHLRDIGSMRLILRHRGDYGHGPHDRAIRILRGEHDALATGNTLCVASPKAFRFLARHRIHEAHGRAAFDAIDEHVAELADLALAERLENLDANGWARRYGTHRESLS